MKFSDKFIQLIFIFILIIGESQGFLSKLRNRVNDDNDNDQDNFRFRSYIGNKLNKIANKLTKEKQDPSKNNENIQIDKDLSLSSTKALKTFPRRFEINHNNSNSRRTFNSSNGEQKNQIDPSRRSHYEHLFGINDHTNKAFLMARLARIIKLNQGLDAEIETNYLFGLHSGYNYRNGDYSNYKGSTCINNLNYNGLIIGKFICPVEGFDYSATECCGQKYEEYCCTPSEALYQLNKPKIKTTNQIPIEIKDKNSLFYSILTVSIVVPLLLVLTAILIVVIIYDCKNKKSNNESVLEEKLVKQQNSVVFEDDTKGEVESDC